MVFYIYKIKDVNYIGSTTNVKRRTTNHKKNVIDKKGVAYNYLIYQYIREKQKNIKLEILAVYKRKCSYKIRLLVEQYWINKYDSVNNGLNTINTFRTEKGKKKYSKEWRLKNRDYLLKQKRLDYIKNKEHYNKMGRLWSKNNRDKIKGYYDKRMKNPLNREKANESSRKSYQKNKHKRSVKINCPKCNCLISSGALRVHQRSNKCKKLSKITNGAIIEVK